MSIPVSAPPRVRDQILSASDGPVPVVHAGPHAVYVALGGRCVGLLGRHATQVPCGLRSRIRSFASWPCESAYVAGGTLYVDHIPLRVGRAVAVQVPKLDHETIPRRAASPATVAATPQAVVAGLVPQGVAPATAPPLRAVVAGLVPQGVAPATAPPLRAVVAGLVPQGVAPATAPPLRAVVAGLVPQGVAPATAPPLRAVVAGLVPQGVAPATAPPLRAVVAGLVRPRVTAATVGQLLGRGPGLTPLGDDVLCGWIATHRAAGVPTPEIDSVVRAGLTLTTLLSATLLDCALHGEVFPELGQFLLAIGTAAEPGRAAALRAVGGTSGAGLLHGARLALDDLVLARAGSEAGAA